MNSTNLRFAKEKRASTVGQTIIPFACNPSQVRKPLQGYRLADCVSGWVVMLETIAG
jgi:hypothetical protein